MPLTFSASTTLPSLTVILFNSFAWFSYSLYIATGSKSLDFSMNCNGRGQLKNPVRPSGSSSSLR